MSAAAVSVRTRNHRDIGARRRFPPADAGSRRFCRSLPAEYGTAGGPAGQTELNRLAPGRYSLGVNWLRGQEIAPDRLVAQRGDKGPMRRAIVLGDPRSERHQALPPRHFAVAGSGGIAALRGKYQLRPPRTD